MQRGGGDRGEGERERESGMKVNVTNAQERGVFDLTNRDTKTLQLALLQVTVIVPYTIKTLGVSAAAVY